MRDRIVHRGPDDGGLWQSQDGRVVLGHRRLSIVDISAAGHQPMSNEDESVWITFNGEIYNHAELRKTLRLDDRHKFRSRADTEVIVHLYEERQARVVEALDGMFAFGIWDAARRRLVLARDRMGKKPLYYTVAAGRLLFASEIKALLAHPDVARRLDFVALNEYLTFSNVPEPKTMFEGISKLPAGHTLVCDEHGRMTIERYWSPLDGPAWTPPANRAEAVEHVRALVKGAVKKRLMADVPVGAFLSGGVDSSTNVALMSQLVSTPLRTFTVEFTGFGPAENFHDVPYARQVAKMFGCNHSEVQVTAEEALAYVPRMVQEQDEPLGDPACLPMHFVSRAAHQAGIKVVLVGEGSDEVFCGYPQFPQLLETYNGKWSQLRRLPRSLRRMVKRGAELAGAPGGRVDVLRRAAEDEPLYMGLDTVFFDYEKAQLYTDAGKRAMPRKAADTISSYYRRSSVADQTRISASRCLTSSSEIVCPSSYSCGWTSTRWHTPSRRVRLSWITSWRRMHCRCPRESRWTASVPRRCSRTRPTSGSPRTWWSDRSRGSACLSRPGSARSWCRGARTSFGGLRFVSSASSITTTSPSSGAVTKKIGRITRSICGV